MPSRLLCFWPLPSRTPLAFSAPVPGRSRCALRVFVSVSALSSQTRNRNRILQAAQSLKSCSHYVVGIGGTDGLRNDIANTNQLHDGANRTAGDHAFPLGRRFEQYTPGAENAQRLVWNG